MRIIDVIQGSPEWLAARAKYPHTASKAPAMMGESKYQTRNELLKEMAGGAIEEVDAGKQFLFDRGHAAEAAARPLVEAMIGDELFPTTATDDAGYLLASYDGITMSGDTGYECKLWNESLAAAVRARDLPPAYYWQLEQQAVVAGLDRIIFVCTDGTPEKFVHMEYRPVAGRAAALMAGWKQFDADLANYQHVEAAPEAVAAPTLQLPALSIQVNGSITLVDNLKVFGERLASFIEGIDKAPQDDQGFADAEAAIKTLTTAETALEAAKASALAQTASIDDMTRTVALYAGQAKQTRLMLEKMVKTRKEQIRLEIIQGGKDAFTAHLSALDKRLGSSCMRAAVAMPDFAGAAKGKRNLASLRDAVDTALANAKIEANAVADRMQINLRSLENLAGAYKFLFRDLAALIEMDAEPFDAIVVSRVNAHKQAEDDRLEAERAKIRAEEVAKLAREQEENTKRLAEEAKAKEQAAAQNIAPVGRLPGAEDAAPAAATNSSIAREPAHVGASPHAKSNTPPPAIAGTQRPSSAQIIVAVADAFGVSDQIAYAWIKESFFNNQKAA